MKRKTLQILVLVGIFACRTAVPHAPKGVDFIVGEDGCVTIVQAPGIDPATTEARLNAEQWWVQSHFPKYRVVQQALGVPGPHQREILVLTGPHGEEANVCFTIGESQ